LVLIDHAAEYSSPVDGGVEWDDGRRVVVGRAVPAALVWPVVVEVSGVLGEDVCGVAFVVDEDSVGALGPDGADEPFGVAVGSWCRGGILTVVMPSEANTASKDAPYLVSRSRTRNRIAETRSSRSATEVERSAFGWLITLGVPT
jgi:hypothetical protein